MKEYQRVRQEIRLESRSLFTAFRFNRLKSIQNDALFVNSVALNYPLLKIIANERAGVCDTTGTATGALHLPPFIPESERAQMEALIPTYTEKFLASGLDIAYLATHIQLPLRPIWHCPSGNYGTADSTQSISIVLVCASRMVHDGLERSGHYCYVQGAADDEESWSRGLTPELFWNHSNDIFLADSVEDVVDDLVYQQLVTNQNTVSSDSIGSNSKISTNTSSSWIFQSATLSIAVGNRASGRPPECWQHYGAVINCGAPEFEHPDSRKYLYLPIPEGKKGAQQLEECIPVAIGFVRSLLKDGPVRLLVHCMQGKDRSVGIAMALMMEFVDFKTKAVIIDGIPRGKKLHHLQNSRLSLT
ncbi:hypothetical protein SmJEL517_g05568 [Synchytrium microbalum]|uniref:Uncharacterized protein n=1 Tax=Synchytrium microbalum TaxID=1806994 RepID=A0A507BUS5_9FUNG|nr:uncharacterized protein SmJEL517_g05568 [Synchytrium microbalum]TPX31028.1 hypothetical protein SmJEL517_g05568 [Synchytrium microbalum]